MNINQVIYFRSVFNPHTGFTKHLLRTNENNKFEKIIVTDRLDCKPETINELLNQGFKFLVQPTESELLKLHPTYTEIHGGLLTIFTYRKYLRFLRKQKLILYNHSTKFHISDIQYLLIKDLFIERAYTFDLAFIVNALMPMKLYLWTIKYILRLGDVLFTIASETKQQAYTSLFRKYNYNLVHIPSGITEENFTPSLIKPKKFAISSFSRAQMVRGLDVIIKSVAHFPSNASLNLFLLPDVSTARLVRLMQDKYYKKKIHIEIGPSDLKTILQSQDIFLFLIRSMRVIPYQPLTVIEALQTGKPVIASSIPQIVELKPHYKNLTILEDYKNPKEVARTVIQTMATYKIFLPETEYFFWQTIIEKQQKLISKFLEN